MVFALRAILRSKGAHIDTRGRELRNEICTCETQKKITAHAACVGQCAGQHFMRRKIEKVEYQEERKCRKRLLSDLQDRGIVTLFDQREGWDRMICTPLRRACSVRTTSHCAVQKKKRPIREHRKNSGKLEADATIHHGRFAQYPAPARL
jgi:hypothetical protein